MGYKFISRSKNDQKNIFNCQKYMVQLISDTIDLINSKRLDHEDNLYNESGVGCVRDDLVFCIIDI